MRTFVFVGAVLLVASTTGVAFAQYPGEVNPCGPSTSDAIANMRYTFQVCAPHPVVREAQEALKEQGYYAGPIDGVRGPETREAIWKFQRAKGLNPTASLDRVTIVELGLGGGEGYASPPTFEGGEKTGAPPLVEMQAP